MRIGLFGIGGVYNFGCEAIVRGTTFFLRNYIPDCQVVYYSLYYEYDTKMLRDLHIEITPVCSNKTFIKRVINKLKWISHYEGCELFYDYNKIIDDVDMLFFIGGDIYTIPIVRREQRRYRYVNRLVEFGKKATTEGVPVVLYGASVGPFGDYGKAVRYYQEALKTYKLILCRERDTIDYLIGLGLNNIVFSPDPAFFIGLSETEKRKEIKNACPKLIGVNLSPLSLSEIFINGNETQITYMAELLRKIRNKFDNDIILLPHVISNDFRDNDVYFMERILESFDEEEKKHFSMADYSGGFLGIKRQLIDCEIVIAARMHCAINAIHENIPTILLSYSQKSIGMCRYVYGCDKWSVDIRKADELLLPKIEEMLQNREELSGFLCKRKNEIIKDFNLNIETIRQMLSQS